MTDSHQQLPVHPIAPSNHDQSMADNIATSRPESRESQLTDLSSHTHPHATSSSVSQTTMADRDTTPPTSAGATSKQSQESLRSINSQTLQYDSANPPIAEEIQVPKTPVQDPEKSRSRRATNASSVPVNRIVTSPTAHGGQKRTASGAIKQSNTSLPTSPIAGRGSGHSRTTSTSSTQSRISELSSELRARLSYAMLKVQNGWQNHNLDEVEQIVSNQNSPTFSPSSNRNRFASPTSPDTHFQSRNMRSPESVAQRYGAFGAHLRNGVSESHNENYVTSPRDTFWHTHAHSPNHKHLQQYGQSVHNPPSLAPAAPLSPRRSQAADQNALPQLKTNISALSHHSSSNSEYHDNNSPTPTFNPSTPRHSQEEKPKTKAEMEQDAVETLMFLSSPGNGSAGGFGSPSSHFTKDTPNLARRAVMMSPSTRRHGVTNSGLLEEESTSSEEDLLGLSGKPLDNGLPLNENDANKAFSSQGSSGVGKSIGSAPERTSTTGAVLDFKKREQELDATLDKMASTEGSEGSGSDGE